MESLFIFVFVLGYLAITLEHNLKIDKLIPALGMMAIIWAMISLGHLDVFEVNTAELRLEPSHLDEILLHHLGKTAEILVFLIGAMTIVEIIDYFNGFSAIKGFVRTNSKVRLLWIFSILAFILSAIIDHHLEKDRQGKRRQVMVCWIDRYRCKCRRSMVTYWRCYNNHVVDWKKGNYA